MKAGLGRLLDSIAGSANVQPEVRAHAVDAAYRGRRGVA